MTKQVLVRCYQARSNKLAGSNYREVYKEAYLLYKSIKKLTKRKPYIRSAYFNKEKIFFDYFWDHLQQKRWRDRTRRLKLFSCALELIKKSQIPPSSKDNVDRKNEILHRFAGITKDRERFFVQIKEFKNGKKKKYLISCFPLK